MNSLTAKSGLYNMHGFKIKSKKRMTILNKVKSIEC